MNLFPFFFFKGTIQHNNSEHGPQRHRNLGSDWHLLIPDLEHKTAYLSLNFLMHKKGLTGSDRCDWQMTQCIWSPVSSAFIIMIKEIEWLLPVECLQVLGNGIAINECQDTHCLDVRNSAQIQKWFLKGLSSQNTIVESTYQAGALVYRGPSWCQTRPGQSSYFLSPSLATHGRWRGPWRKGSFGCEGKVKELMEKEEILKGQPGSLRGQVLPIQKNTPRD